MKEKIYRSGLIPYFINENGDIEMLFMKPSDPKFGGPDYQIAKGRVEDDDENFKEAAIREAEEELGLYRSNLMDVFELGNFLGRTSVFVGQVKNKDLFGVPDFETDSTRWMTEKEFLISGRPLHKPIIKEAVDQIKSRLP